MPSGSKQHKYLYKKKINGKWRYWYKETKKDLDELVNEGKNKLQRLLDRLTKSGLHERKTVEYGTLYDFRSEANNRNPNAVLQGPSKTIRGLAISERAKGLGRTKNRGEVLKEANHTMPLARKLVYRSVKNDKRPTEMTTDINFQGDPQWFDRRYYGRNKGYAETETLSEHNKKINRIKKQNSKKK